MGSTPEPGRMRQAVPPGVVLAAEIAAGLVIGAVPFVLIMFGAS